MIAVAITEYVQQAISVLSYFELIYWIYCIDRSKLILVVAYRGYLVDIFIAISTVIYFRWSV